MKYLSEIIKDSQTEAYKRADAFFCFSESQFNEQKKEGVTYVSLGGGLVCNKEKADQLVDDLHTIITNGITEDVQLHGMTAIIHRELANHEAYYTGDIESTMDALEAYPVTREEVLQVFRKEMDEQLVY